MLGWTAYFSVNTFFAITFSNKVPGIFHYVNVLVFMAFGLISTHLFRNIIHRFNWVNYSFEKQLLLFFAMLTGTGILLYLGYYFVLSFVWKGKAMFAPVFVGIASSFIITAIWWLIYFIWHYIERNRSSQVGQLQLETTVKELELKTIKAQLNPHFIFNALNSIRALVDENPQRARTAITELSNILRSSMATEKAETVSLENELNIVKDYLALEHIRFEERLSVQYEIDPDTLEMPVPPMMLQTLVENAIKHGISRMISGGTVFITSRLIGMQHEITIENTGQIVENNINGHGFGLQSTRQRLSLLFGNRATFDIRNKDEKTVEARVVMPLL
ncbi:hypothetical protein MMC2321_05278 [Chitinophaga sp. MM2321]